MSQNIVDYSGNPTGPQLMDNYLDKEQENRLTTNSGIQRPTYAKAGTFWINSSANPWVLYFYNGSIDVAIGTIGTGSSGTFTVEGVDDSSYVHKTGDEAIGGVKTFAGAIKISSDSGNKASYQRDGIEFFPLTTATNGGFIDFHYAGSTADYTSRIIENSSGNLNLACTSVTSPTPATSDNSNKIATTAFVKATVNTLLSSVYPVGSTYITTNSTCPLATLISGSTWDLVGSGRVLQGADSSHAAGSTIEAGLPNITGSIKEIASQSNNVSMSCTGAFSADISGTATGYGTQKSGGYDTARFDASDSNSIYGNSTTVQPPAYVVNIFKRTA